jgi:hypothetical protein
MGVAKTQVLSLGAANSSSGGWGNLYGGVYLPHLGCGNRITRDAEFIVQGPQTIRRSIETVLVKLLQVEGDFAQGVDQGRIFRPLGQGTRNERKDYEHKAQETDGTLDQHIAPLTNNAEQKILFIKEIRWKT